VRVKNLKCAELGRTIDCWADEWWQPASIKTYNTLFEEHLATGEENAALTSHVLALGLHLGLDCVQGVANNCIGSTVEQATESSAEKLSSPIAAAFLIVSHVLKKRTVFIE
jgi:hypothetical protein